MDITFCDLCNESVPQGDLEKGKAVRRGDRVICAQCEAAMSGEEAEKAAAAPAQEATATPLPAGVEDETKIGAASPDDETTVVEAVSAAMSVPPTFEVTSVSSAGAAVGVALEPANLSPWRNRIGAAGTGGKSTKVLPASKLRGSRGRQGFTACKPRSAPSMPRRLNSTPPTGPGSLRSTIN